MKLDRKLIRKMILKEMKLLNEAPTPENVIAYGNRSGQNEALEGLINALSFFDQNRKHHGPQFGKKHMYTAGTNQMTNDISYYAMSICGALTNLLREDRARVFDLKLGDQIQKLGKELQDILDENK